MAQRLRWKIGDDYRQMGYPLFVQGALLTEEAGRLGHGEEQRTIYLVAARYLEEARTHGFPPGREDQGLLLLGDSLYRAEHYAESLPVLREVYEQNPDLQHTLARMLSTAYLRNTVPNLKAAKQYTEVWLQDPSLTDDDRDLATLQLAEIYLDSHDPEACRSALSKIAPNRLTKDRLCCSPDVWRCSKGTRSSLRWRIPDSTTRMAKTSIGKRLVC